MLLITMHEVTIGGKEQLPEDLHLFGKVHERQRGFATFLSLGEALLRIRSYQHYLNSTVAEVGETSWSLVSVSTIDDLSEDEMEMAGVWNVDHLAEG